MLKIILMRHAAAQLEQYGKNDRERTITMAGMHEIDAIRGQIIGQLDSVNIVLCSNVKRTRQTLESVRTFLPQTAAINFDDTIYQASAEVLWHKIQTTSSTHKCIMIFGHNPCLTNIINAVEPGRIEHFPTSGIVFLESNVKKWHEISPYNLMITKFFNPQ